MPLPVMNFPMLSFEEANPVIAGLQSAQNLAAQRQKIQEEATQQKYLEPTLQEALRQSQLKTQLLQSQAQYAPQITLAELALKQQQIPRMQAETQKLLQEMKYYPEEVQSQIKERLAQTGLLGAETKYMPLKYALEQAKMAQVGERFGPSYQISRLLGAMPKAASAQEIANRQETYDQLVTNVMNKALQGQQVPPQLLSQIKDLQQQLGGQTQISAEPQSTLQQQLQGQQQATVAQQPTPQQTEQLRDISLLDANRKSVGSQMNKRADAAIVLEDWFHKNREEYAPRILDATQYAGVIGKGKKATDEWLNKHPNAISNYDWYTNIFTPNLSNQLRMMEAMGATDQQREELNKMVNDINNVRSNPQRAKMAINKLFGTVQDISESVFEGAEPINKGIYRRLHNVPKLKGDYLDAKAPTPMAQAGITQPIARTTENDPLGIR